MRLLWLLVSYNCLLLSYGSNLVHNPLDQEDGFRPVQFVDMPTEEPSPSPKPVLVPAPDPAKKSPTHVITKEDKETSIWMELKEELHHLRHLRAKDLKTLARLQYENRKLKENLKKVENDQKWANRQLKTSSIIASNSENDKILGKMSTDLQNLKSNMQNIIETQTTVGPDSNGGPRVADFGLRREMEGLKQDIAAIKLLEDQNFPTVLTNLSRQAKKLDHLAQTTDQLESKIFGQNLSSLEYSVHDSHVEVEKMDLKLNQLGGVTDDLQDKLATLNDKYTWYSFLVEHFNTELHLVKGELYKMMKFFYKIEGPLPGLEDSDQYHMPENDSEISANAEPHIYVSDTDKKRQNLRLELDQLAMRANDAYAAVHQMTSKMAILETDQSKLSRQVTAMNQEKIDSSAVQQIFNRLKEMKHEIDGLTKSQDKLRLKLADRNHMTSDELFELKKSLNSFGFQVDRAVSLGTVVKDHQVQHFSAIQNLKHQVHELTSAMRVHGLKLANLQTEILNSSLNTYKDSNKDLQQDVQISAFQGEIERLEKKFDTMQDSLKSVLVSLRQKAERTDMKKMLTDVEEISGKIQTISSIGDHVTVIGSGLNRLESQLPRDCSFDNVPANTDHFQSGIYLIKPKNSQQSILAKCDMDEDGGQWTVVQQRSNGQESFNRTWAEYESGFGKPDSDFWLGNLHIRALVQNQYAQSKNQYQLKIDAWNIFDDYFYALYDNFSIGSAEEKYALSVNGYTGNLTDSLGSYHNGMKFSTPDMDFDASSTHCAKYYESGWWFSHCQMANLNGNFGIGMIWFSNVTQDWLQLKRTVMKIRPKNL